MSNDKQSSIDFLIKQKEKWGLLINDDLQKAKAMHKKEIITAHSTALPIEDGVFTAIDKAQLYYNEKFGDNNE